MARYYFHLHEGGTITSDEEGNDLPDLAAVRARAVEAAREVMCADVAEGRLCLACCIKVVDADDRPVLSVPFRETIVVTGLSTAA